MFMPRWYHGGYSLSTVCSGVRWWDGSDVVGECPGLP